MSALNKDSQVLELLRRNYRERWRNARMSFSYQPVTRTDINSSSALQKEVVWK